jgi:hypothetical protein
MKTIRSDPYRRRLVSENEYQCGCHWERRDGFGDVLVECAIHRQATTSTFERIDRDHGR